MTFRASPLGERLTHYPKENIFFVNFEGHQVKSSEQIKKIDDAVSKILDPVDKRVYTVASYDKFNTLPELIDEYTEMVRGVVKNLYMNTTCYSTNAFARIKIGEALTEKKLTPHMYESREAAQKALKLEG